MSNMDWEKFGSDIRKTVQDAIDSQDYRELNRSISNTVNETFGGVFEGLGSGLQSGISSIRDSIQQEYEKQTTGQTVVRTPNAEVITNVEKKYTGRRNSKYFMNVTSMKATGILLAIFGFIGASIFLPLTLVGALGSVFGQAFGIGAGVMGLLTLGSLTSGISGVRILGKAKRFQNYIKYLNGREYCDIEDLSTLSGKPKKFLLKDLKRMIRRGWFKQGRLDRQSSCFMVTDQAYEQYQALLLQTEQQKLIQEAEEMRNNHEELDPEVQEIVKLGDSYLNKIKASNEAISDVEVSNKIYRMEILVDRIFSRIKEAPDQIPDVRRLMDYYLPTTVKLLDAYEVLDSQPIKGANIINSKKEIEQTLDTLNIAFEKLLDSMFQSKAMDLSTDISVLQTMLAQEGLTKKDFNLSK